MTESGRGDKPAVPPLVSLWLVPVVILLDQVSKYAVVHALTRLVPLPVVDDFLRLTYISNRGSAFGLNLGSPLIHTVISVAALGMLAWLFWTLPRRAGLLRLALSMVLGGAIGNIIDRLRLGHVIDFIDVGFGEHWRWYIFNVADSFVTVGVLLLAFGYRWQQETPDPQPSQLPQADDAPGQ